MSVKASRRDEGGSRGGETSGALVAASASGAETECTNVHVSTSASRERPSALLPLFSAMAYGSDQKIYDTAGNCQIECINLDYGHTAISTCTHTYIHMVITRAQGYLARIRVQTVHQVGHPCVASVGGVWQEAGSLPAGNAAARTGQTLSRQKEGK